MNSNGELFPSLKDWAEGAIRLAKRIWCLRVALYGEDA